MTFLQNIALLPEVYRPVVVCVVHPPDVLGEPVHVGPRVTSLHHRPEVKVSKYLFLSSIKRFFNVDR